ncbi:MAG TPA: hypothetical protein VH595_07910 [Verrucomicrobiae bacterium]|jgi:hypothetical protein|nr:hypothetical protein [Verrucomicrobiae bacterium]
MSMINDALKRASQSDKNRPAQAALPQPMQPVSRERETRFSWILAAIVVAVLGIGLAGWVFWKWWEGNQPAVVAAPVQPMQTAVAAPPPPPPLPTPPAPAIVVAPAAPAPVPMAAPVKPSWPIALTVKAIFYNKTSPHALVNGRTVEAGDTIQGVLISRIEADRVLVSWNGESKELLLGDGK